MENAKPRTTRRQAAQRRRVHNVLLAGVFLLVAALFLLINLFTRDREFSQAENRNLAQRPALTLGTLVSGDYFSGLTDWYNDQFFARDRWMSLSLKENTALGRRDVNGVFLGRDGYLLGAPEAPMDDALAKTVSAVNRFSGSHPELSVRMLLVPCAAAILPQELPKNAPVRDQLQDIQNVIAQLEGSIQVLDVSQALSQHGDEAIYYKTDHHWTSLGAYYAFSAVSGSLGIGDPIQDYDIYTVSTTFEGTLASKSGSHAVTDEIQVYTPKNSGVSYYVTYGDGGEKICSIYDSSALDAKDQYTLFFGGNHPLVKIRTTANNGRSLLVFKDSYANCFIQFLIPYYESIVMVDPRYYYDSLDAVLNGSAITDVLYLYSANTFLTDTSLADVLTSGTTENTETTSQTSPSSDAPSSDAQDSALESSVQETETAGQADSALEGSQE